MKTAVFKDSFIILGDFLKKIIRIFFTRYVKAVGQNICMPVLIS